MATAAEDGVRVPGPYWVISGLGLIWNAFGGYDYWMTRTRNMEYLGQIGDPQVMLDWIDSFPVWAQIGWGLGVWGSVAGSVLMLLRSRHAVTAFALSLLGAVLSFSYQLIGSVPAEFDTAAGKFMPLVIMAIVIALMLYCRRAVRLGILR